MDGHRKVLTLAAAALSGWAWPATVPAVETQAQGVLVRFDADGMAAWADEWSASKPEAHMQEILRVEFGGVSEAFYNLAAATNDDR